MNLSRIKLAELGIASSFVLSATDLTIRLPDTPEIKTSFCAEKPAPQQHYASRTLGPFSSSRTRDKYFAFNI
jgi:hypothetical protein